MRLELGQGGGMFGCCALLFWVPHQGPTLAKCHAWRLAFLLGLHFLWSWGVGEENAYAWMSAQVGNRQRSASQLYVGNVAPTRQLW